MNKQELQKIKSLWESDLLTIDYQVWADRVWVAYQKQLQINEDTNSKIMHLQSKIEELQYELERKELNG